MRYQDLLEKRMQPSIKDFEKILFGSMNGSERDTEYESRVFKAIESYITGSNDSMFLNQAMKLLVKNKDKFPNILKPTHDTLYRGIAVSEEYIRNFSEQYIYGHHQTTDVLGTTTYKPKRLIESWSSDKKTALKFTGYNHDYPNPDNIYQLLLIAKTDDTFLFNTKFTNIIANKYLDSIEHEVFRVSLTPIVVGFSLPQKTINLMKNNGIRYKD